VNKSNPAKIFYVFSYGLTSLSQTTLDALAAMRSCGVVRTLSADAATARRLSDLGCHVTAWPGCNYKKMTKAILGDLRNFNTVGLPTYGNPVFLDEPLLEMTRTVSAAAEVRVITGISSFDMLMNMFNFAGLAPEGMRLMDANSINAKFIPTPLMDTLFFSPAQIVLDKRNIFLKFTKSLCTKYPAGSPVYLVKCAFGGKSREVIKACTNCLPELLLSRCGLQHTLFIPSSRRREGLEANLAWKTFSIDNACSCGGRSRGPSTKRDAGANRDKKRNGPRPSFIKRS